MFRLLQSITALRASWYQVASQHNLQTHVENLVAEMSTKKETLPFTYLPDHEREVDLKADLGEDTIKLLQYTIASDTWTLLRCLRSPVTRLTSGQQTRPSSSEHWELFAPLSSPVRR